MRCPRCQGEKLEKRCPLCKGFGQIADPSLWELMKKLPLVAIDKTPPDPDLDF
jgi:hypothetical protein